MSLTVCFNPSDGFGTQALKTFLALLLIKPLLHTIKYKTIFDPPNTSYLTFRSSDGKQIQSDKPHFYVLN